MTVDAVVFDWGGTLTHDPVIDHVGLWRDAAACLAAATDGDGDQLAAHLLDAERRLWARCEETRLSFTLAEIFAAHMGGLSGERARDVLDEASSCYLEAWAAHLSHHPATAVTLKRLRAMGLAIGMLSNTHWPAAFHERLLARDGLAPLIDVRAYTSDMERAKPDPAAFGVVLGHLGLPPARVVFVGDRPRDDVWGAQQAGMRAIWKRHPMAPPLDGVVPDAVIDDLEELPALVAAWRTAN